MSVSEEREITLRPATEDLWCVAETDDTDALAGIRTIGVEINACNEHGMTALMRAACHGKVRMVRALLEHGADPNLSRSDKFTALTLAAFFGHTEVVRILIAHGAETNAATRSGTSAYKWATARSFDEIARCLEKSGGKPTKIKVTGTVSGGKETPVLATASSSSSTGKRSGGAVESLASLHQNSPEPAAPVKVKTLKDPPEIWDLVHEAPRNFDPRSAFVSRLKAMNTSFALWMLAGLLLVAAASVGLLVLRGSRAEPVQGSPDVSSKHGATESTMSAPRNVGDQARESLASPAVSDTGAAPSDNAARSHHVRPDAVSLDDSSQLPPSTPAAVAEWAGENDRRNTRKLRALTNPNRSRSITTDARVRNVNGDELEKVVPAVARPQFESRISSEGLPKTKATPTLSTQLIEPTKGSAPKPKVIQWP